MKIKYTNVIQLSQTQIAMLNMSDEDIRNHRVTPCDEVDEEDREWLKNLKF